MVRECNSKVECLLAMQEVMGSVPNATRRREGNGGGGEEEMEKDRKKREEGERGGE